MYWSREAGNSDRLPGGLVHFQYNYDGDGISMVTAMLPAAASAFFDFSTPPMRDNDD